MDTDQNPSYEPPVSVAFPADLTREEFCRFQELVARSTTAYRFRSLQLITTGLLLVFCVLIVAYDLRQMGQINWSFLVMTILLVIMEAYFFVVVPRTMRRRS